MSGDLQSSLEERCVVVQRSINPDIAEDNESMTAMNSKRMDGRRRVPEVEKTQDRATCRAHRVHQQVSTFRCHLPVPGGRKR